MRIAVTGGMGFIGHEVADRLISEGHEVIVVDHWKDLIQRYEKTKMSVLQELYWILPRCYELTEPWNFVNTLEAFDPDIVVHAGAVVDTTDLGSDTLLSENVDFTEGLAEACSEHGTDIIFFSSAAVYGNDGRPNNPYGLTKALGEQVMRRAKGIRTASLRLFNVFGRHEGHKGAMASVPWKIARAFDVGGTFELHSPTARRDFVPSSTVVDVVSTLTREMETDCKTWHREFDVGTGIPLSYDALVDEIARVKKGDRNKTIRMVERPVHLEGRYQMYTCAGKNGALNLGGRMGTPEGIRRAYGVDR